MPSSILLRCVKSSTLLHPCKAGRYGGSLGGGVGGSDISGLGAISTSDWSDLSEWWAEWGAELLCPPFSLLPDSASLSLSDSNCCKPNWQLAYFWRHKLKWTTQEMEKYRSSLFVWLFCLFNCLILTLGTIQQPGLTLFEGLHIKWLPPCLITKIKPQVTPSVTHKYHCLVSE